jgi:hypothetical protein
MATPLNQLTLSGSWSIKAIGEGLDTAPGSPLTCFAADGNARVYYTDPNLSLSSLAWVAGGWYVDSLTTAAGSFQAIFQRGQGVVREGSALTCFGVNGTQPRVYFFDENNHVNEMAWVGGNETGGNWVNNILPTPKAPAVAAARGGLTCYGVNGHDSRVYYLD